MSDVMRLKWRARWKALVRPSLARRVMLALLLAASLSFVVLVSIDWLAVNLGGTDARAMPFETRALALSLPPDDAQAAVAIVRAADVRLQILRQAAGMELGSVRLRLERLPSSADPLGQPPALLYQSPQTPAAPPATTGFAPSPNPAAAPSPASSTSELPTVESELVSAGQRYWVAQHRTGVWQLTLYEPVPPEVSLLRWLSSDLLPSYLIALSLLVGPLWWAVWRGLRPLRQFVAQMSAQTPEDPQPLALNLRYAELQPLSGAFESLLGKVRLSLQRERQLVQDAAHELRTPLAVISAQAHALAQAGNAAQRQQAEAALERALQRASHLVHQLLSLAALDDAAPLRPGSSTDLVALARQQLISLAPLAQTQSIELEMKSPEALWAVVEVSALLSIIDNLLSNALRYTPAGSQVLLRLEGSDGGWALCVADDGPGITPEDQARLFERFQRGREARNTGSGLGLAIVRQAAQRLGGEIGLGPGLNGRGVSFNLRVPASGQRLAPAQAGGN